MASNFERTAKNISMTFVSHVLSLLLSFVARTVFVHLLSVEYLGIGGLFSNILTILSFAELGIGNVIVFCLYEPIKKQNNAKIHALLDLYRKAYLIIAVGILLIGLAVNPFIERLISEVPDIPEDIHLLFILYLVNTCASYFAAYKKSLLLADQKSYYVNLTMNLVQILTLAGQCFVLIVFHSYLLYLVCQIVSTALVNIILSMITDRVYRQVFSAPAGRLEKAEITEIFRKIRIIAISRVSGIVSNGTDNMIVSKMFGLAPVGLLSNYTMIISSVNSIFYNAVSSISAGLGRLNVDSSVEVKRQVYDELTSAVYLVYSFLCTCFYVLTEPFIRQWIGNDFLLDHWTMIHLVIAVFVSGMNYPVYSFRTTSGHFKEAQNAYIACAVVNVLLSVVLGKIIGLSGVFMATWVSKMIPEYADSKCTYQTILNKRHRQYLLKYLGLAAMAAGNALATQWIVALLPMEGWIGFFTKAVCCGVLTIGINLLLMWNYPGFQGVLARIVQLIRRKIGHA